MPIAKLQEPALVTLARMPRPFDPQPRHDMMRQLFAITLISRILVVALLTAFQGSIEEISRDSAEYHTTGIELAEAFARGEMDWSRWIDDGWKQFVGVLYLLIGPRLVGVLAVNAILSAWAAVLAYRLALNVYRDDAVATVSAYTFALFPSIVYYTSLPLKEAPAVFALLGLAWGIRHFIQGRQSLGLRWIAVSLAIIAALRIYLFFVCLGCTVVCLIPMHVTGDIKGALKVGACLATLGGGTFLAVQYSGVDLEEHESLQYFDLDYINNVRVDMNAGKSKLFENDDASAYGQDIVQDVVNAAKGLMFFFLSIDVTNIRRDRQMAAIPEMLFFIYCLPYFIYGLLGSWRRMPARTMPVVMLACVLVFVYGATTTNMGAMYRWRVQALPFLIMILMYGATVRRGGLLYSIVRRFGPPPPPSSRRPIPVPAEARPPAPASAPVPEWKR